MKKQTYLSFSFKDLFLVQQVFFQELMKCLELFLHVNWF